MHRGRSTRGDGLIAADNGVPPGSGFVQERYSYPHALLNQSPPRSSNPACRFPVPGSRTEHHAFAHCRSRRRPRSRTSTVPGFVPAACYHLVMGYRLISRTFFIDRHCFCAAVFSPPRTTDRPYVELHIRPKSGPSMSRTKRQRCHTRSGGRYDVHGNGTPACQRSPTLDHRW